MLKHAYIVISLLSIVNLMHGMEDASKRSALSVFNNALNAVADKIQEIPSIAGTMTTIENQLGDIGNEVKNDLSLLGVKPQNAYDAAVVFGALYLTAETSKYIYRRYIASDDDQSLDASALAAGQAVAQANSNINALGQFVSQQQINDIVQKKWDELVASGKFADKDYVDTATAQTRNMVTSALETTASRVTVLEGQVKGLIVAINGDKEAKKNGIFTLLDALANRMAALENQSHLDSGTQGHAQSKGEGLMSKFFGRRKKGSDSAVHGASHAVGDNHSHDDDSENEDDSEKSATLHAPGKNDNDTL